MTYSACRYKLLQAAGYWSDDYAHLVGYVYMSSIPSTNDIFDVLRQHGQLKNLDKDYVDNLLIDRSDGWHYKKIKIYAYGDERRCIWIFEPAP
jgi:hypothetical protein